jgi:hypothetical protein
MQPSESGMVACLLTCEAHDAADAIALVQLGAGVEAGDPDAQAQLATLVRMVAERRAGARRQRLARQREKRAEVAAQRRVSIRCWHVGPWARRDAPPARVRVRPCYRRRGSGRPGARRRASSPRGSPSGDAEPGEPAGRADDLAASRRSTCACRAGGA